MRSLHIILLSIIAAMMAGCSGHDAPDNGSVGKDDSDSADRTSLRTILIYMVANNSLGNYNYDQYDINEMVAASQQGWDEGYRVLLFRSSTDNNQTLNEVTSEGLVTLVTYDPELSSVSPQRITEVISDSRELAPALDYGLILWSHSDAWLSPADGTDASQQRAFGDDRGWHLSIPELAKVLEPWEFSFLYFDCCYMANVESLYELRKCASWVVASAIELPAAGMNYTTNLPLLLQPEADLIGAAKATFEHYNSLTNDRRTCAMSVIDLRQLDNLAQITREVYEQSLQPGSDYTPQRFTPGSASTPCYLFDFASYIEAHRHLDPALLTKWQSALDAAVVYHAATPQIWGYFDIKAHCGLSTYIIQSPSLASTRGYDSLQWWADVASAKF